MMSLNAFILSNQSLFDGTRSTSQASRAYQSPEIESI
jgi:hypothetical protein